MKKKLTVNRIAFGNLRTRKKQYTLMIVGIILAMIFSSGVLFFLFCMGSSLEEINLNAFGKQDVISHSTDSFDGEAAVESGKLKDYGYVYALGYAYTDEENYDDGALVAKYTKNGKRVSHVSVKEGRYPEKEGEIAFESDALLRMRIDAEIGDKITLRLKPTDGNSYLEGSVEKTYTLVGILWDKRAYMEVDTFDMPAAAVYDGERVELGGRERELIYADFVDWGISYEYMRDFFYSEDETSPIRHLWTYAGSTNNSSYNVTTENIILTMIFALVLTVVLLIASCFGIVNSFNTNLKERKTQIGLLRAVGTTKRQIIKIFGREAILISVLATPVSILLSYFGVKLVISMLGEPFRFIPEWWVLILCGVFSIICVMAAAMIPLVGASRVSPMQAIRNTELTRRMKNKKIKSQKSFNAPELIAKRNLIFYRSKKVGVCVVLIITIFITSFGTSIYGYMEKGAQMGSDYFRGDYDIYPKGGFEYSKTINYSQSYENNGVSVNDARDILSLPYVSDINGYKTCNANILVDEYSDLLTQLSLRSGDMGRYYPDQNEPPADDSFEDYVKRNTKLEDSRYVATKEKMKHDCELFSVGLFGYDTEDVENLKEHVIDGEINIDKLNSGEEVILCFPKELCFVFMAEDEYRISNYSWHDKKELEPGGLYEEWNKFIVDTKICDYKAGDEITLSFLSTDEEWSENGGNGKIPDNIERFDKKVKIGAIVESKSVGDWSQYMDLFTTVEGFEAFMPGRDYLRLSINLKEECTPEIDEEITQMINTVISGKDMGLNSVFEDTKETRRLLTGIIIAMVSIVILFFCICASIINNSLTAQIRESKREIGTLRAVGASTRELMKAFVYQMLSMFGWGCGLGFGLYTAVHLIIRGVNRSLNESIPLEYSIIPSIIACAALFLVCSFNLYFKIRKQTKNSIVENIREL